MVAHKVRIEVAARHWRFLSSASDSRFVVMYGGASSAKSWSMAAHIVKLFFSQDGIGILVLRKTRPAVRKSCYRLIKHWLSVWGVPYRENKSEMMVYAPNGSFIQFDGLDDVEKLKCYSEDTEVLTDHGFVDVADVKTGDRLASMDPKTRMASYQAVEKTWAYDYSGPMICPKTETGRQLPWVDFCVTPNHNMLIRTNYRKNLRFVQAKDLPGSYWIPRHAAWDGEWRDTYTIPQSDSPHTVQPTTFPIVPFLKFLGWHISDGSFGCDQRYQLSISQIKEKGRQQIRDDLKSFPYPVWEGKTAFSVAGKDLYEYMHQYGHYSHERRIPSDILKLHPKLLRHLFDALIAGDGTKTATGRCVYTTNSPGLVDDMSVLAIKLGYMPTVKKWIPKYKGNYSNGRPYWSISMAKHTDTCLRDVRTIDYRGKVYCFSVPPYHTVLIRRNGRVMWCGQSIEGINYVWMEEATEFNYHDFLQLHIRCRAHNFHQRNQLFLTFNPVDPLSNKWLKDLTDQRPACTFLNAPCQILHCTHTDNLFLSEDEHAAIEALADADEEYNKIYRLGEWAIPTQIIFTNWNVVDDVPLVDDYAYGLDFGYIHPTALIWVGINEHDIYLREIIYQTHTTNAELIDLMKQEDIGPEDTIMADSAEPAYIQEIADAGFNVHGVVKTGGQGDKSFVRTGIDRMKRMRLHITADSPNLKSEFETYKWKVTKDGLVLPEPVKFHDDGVDASRYVIGSLPDDAELLILGEYEY
jgi:PBSX family phage terminase large subunit